METTILDDFLGGKMPVCKVNVYHTKVKGMGVKVPYCLWCGELLTRSKKSSINKLK